MDEYFDGYADDLVGFVKTGLEELGFQIESDPTYSEIYRLDFTINRVQNVHAAVNLGVKVTLEAENVDLQEQFLHAIRRGVVHKAIFVELNEANLETGAIQVLFGACIAFLFDRRYTQFRAVGVRVFEDSTFHFFGLEENVQRLQREYRTEKPPEGDQRFGHIIAYFVNKGFGFIEDDGHQKYFFHIAQVQDEGLRLRLPSYVPGDSIPVGFFYGGHDGKRYPKAVAVTTRSDEVT